MRPSSTCCGVGGAVWADTGSGVASQSANATAAKGDGREEPGHPERSIKVTRSHLLGAHFGDLDRRYPGLLGPADAFACDLHVEQVGLALDRMLAGPHERLLQLRRALHDLAVDAEAL